VSQEVQHKPPK